MPPKKEKKKVRVTDDTHKQIEILRHPYSARKYIEILVSREYRKRIIPVVDQIDQQLKRQLIPIQHIRKHIQRMLPNE